MQQTKATKINQVHCIQGGPKK